MSTPKPPHTPGPWVLEDPWTVVLAACEDALALAMMVGEGVNPHSYRAVQCYGTLRAAIARARGETP